MTRQTSVLAIGDELLRGELVDTNSAWLCQQLFDVGIPVTRCESVGDAAAEITSAFTRLSAGADLILATGGLGPTDDDRTAAALAQAMDEPLELDVPSLDAIREWFAGYRLKMTANNEKQAWLPRSAEALSNQYGTAPGISAKLGACRIFCFPGVPREMRGMFRDHVKPWILAGRDSSPPISRVYKFFGIGESHIDAALADLLDDPLVQAYAGNVTVHYRTSFPSNQVTLIARPGSETRAVDSDRVLETLDEQIQLRLGRQLYGHGDESLAEAVVAALRDADATVAFAESCTAGGAAELLTQAPGSSQVFELGIVAYADRIKRDLLGVDAALLERDGAVSRSCVEAMAAGVRERAGATFGVAISGIAGPAGGTPDKPIGTVHFAVCGPSGSRHLHRVFPFDRARNRTLASHVGLWLVYTALRDGLSEPAPDPLPGRWVAKQRP